MDQEVKNKEVVESKPKGKSIFKNRKPLIFSIIGILAIFILTMVALSLEDLQYTIIFVFLCLFSLLLGILIFKKSHSKGLKIRYVIFVLLFLLAYLRLACVTSSLSCERIFAVFKPASFAIMPFYLSGVGVFRLLIRAIFDLRSLGDSLRNLLDFIPGLLSIIVLFFYIVILPEIKLKPVVRIFIILGVIFLALNIFLFLAYLRPY